MHCLGSLVPDICWCLIEVAVTVYKKAHTREKQLHQHMVCVCEEQCCCHTIMPTSVLNLADAGAEYQYMYQCQSSTTWTADCAAHHKLKYRYIHRHSLQSQLYKRQGFTCHLPSQQIYVAGPFNPDCSFSIQNALVRSSPQPCLTAYCHLHGILSGSAQAVCSWKHVSEIHSIKKAPRTANICPLA